MMDCLIKKFLADEDIAMLQDWPAHGTASRRVKNLLYFKANSL